PETSDLSEVTAQIEKFMNSMQRGLAFSIDEKSGSQVVSVLDKRSGEVIRQIPSEDMLVIARQMADKAAGILLKTEV
ncbi:flagellar protein FlaG, partial [Vibrio cholerae]|nr:flagellar protein FlaG [Vibrio cholerae]